MARTRQQRKKSQTRKRRGGGPLADRWKAYSRQKGLLPKSGEEELSWRNKPWSASSAFNPMAYVRRNRGRRAALAERTAWRAGLPQTVTLPRAPLTAEDCASFTEGVSATLSETSATLAETQRALEESQSSVRDLTSKLEAAGSSSDGEPPVGAPAATEGERTTAATEGERSTQNIGGGGRRNRRSQRRQTKRGGRRNQRSQRRQRRRRN